MGNPVRKVRQSGRNILSMFPSAKMGIPVACESTIELDLCYLLELSPQVTSYLAQPFTISAAFQDGTAHSYTPDFQVAGSADTLLIECKPADKLETESVRQQVTIGSAWCEEHGCRFLVITDAELRVGSCLANAKLLYRYSRLHLPETLQRYVRATLPLYPALVTFGTLVRCLADSEQARLWKQSDLEARSFAFALLFHGVVATDLDRSLVDASPVWLPDPSLPLGGFEYGPLALR